MPAKPKDNHTGASSEKAIEELLEANTAVMRAWFARDDAEQRLKAEQVVKSVTEARQKSDAAD